MQLRLREQASLPTGIGQATPSRRPLPWRSGLWSQTGNLDDLDTEELLINLAERALVQLDQKTDADGNVRRRFRLHDLRHDYAVRIAGEPRVVHQKLLDAYEKRCPDGRPSGPDGGYFFQGLCQHLATAAGNWDESVALLCDLRFVEARCRVGQVFELISDYRLARENLPEAHANLREEHARRNSLNRYTRGVRGRDTRRAARRVREFG